MKLPALALLAAALCACERPSGPQAAGASVVADFTASEAVSGALNWKLRAKAAQIDEKEGHIHFSEPSVRFYEKKELVSEISSVRGELQTRNREAVLTDSVKVNAAKDGLRLDTEKLYYSTARNKIWTDEPVTIHRGKTIIKGRGFTANPDLSEIEITRQETRLSPE